MRRGKKRALDTRNKVVSEEFACKCHRCGHEFWTSVAIYNQMKEMVWCPECESIYYEAKHPYFPSEIEDSLVMVDAPFVDTELHVLSKRDGRRINRPWIRRRSPF